MYKKGIKLQTSVFLRLCYFSKKYELYANILKNTSIYVKINYITYY